MPSRFLLTVASLLAALSLVFLSACAPTGLQQEYPGEDTPTEYSPYGGQETATEEGPYAGPETNTPSALATATRTPLPGVPSNTPATPVATRTGQPPGQASPTLPLRTPSPTPSPTATRGPSPTPTPPFLALPGTPLPLPFDPVTASNSGRVSALAEFRTQPVTDLAWTPDNRFLAVAGAKTIELYDLQERLLKRSLYPTAEGIVDIAFSPNEAWLVAGSRQASEQGGQISRLELWQGPDWRPLGLLFASGSGLNELSFTPDSRLMLATFARAEILQESSVEIWNAATWEITGTLKLGTALNIAISPNSATLAVTPDRYAVKLWNLFKDQFLFSLPTSFTGAVNCMAFSPKGDLLATGHYDGAIRIWDPATGDLLRTWQTIGVVESLAFSPDGSLLATGASFKEAEVRLWDVATGTLLRELPGHTAGVTRMLFTSDGQVLVTASYDGLVRLWGIRPY